MIKPIYKKGYVALITTLVVGALSSFAVLGMLSIGTIQTQTSLVSYDGSRAGFLADACAEYALQEIRNSTSFSGSGNITIGAGSCFYDVIGGIGQTRTIESEATVKNSTRRVVVTIDQINPLINVTSWNFVDQF